MIKIPHFNTSLDAAHFWFHYGFKPIPIVPGQKRPALHYYPWLDDLSAESIELHWRQHPDHDVGCVLSQDFVVLDADTPEAEAALWALEREHSVPPLLRVRTRRGCHHFFALATGTFVKPDSHDTVGHPDRLDVRAGQNSLVLPPSGPRKIEALDAQSVEELTVVDQAFIDAVFQHNGRKPPRPVQGPSTSPLVVAGENHSERLASLLEFIDPDCGYEDWVHILMALHHETGGSDEGLDLADAWSREGTKYKGRQEIEAKWRSFSAGCTNPVTIASLSFIASSAGADIADIMTEQFEPCEFVVVEQDGSARRFAVIAGHPLDRFSLRGRARELAREAEEATPLLGNVALKAQGTVIYAAPNTGKTLLMLYLLIQAIMRGLIDAAHVYYLNLDDTLDGLLEKLAIADEYGFHMLSEGFGGSGSCGHFKVRDFPHVIREVIDTSRAPDTVLVLDTLKRFTNLMDKAASSVFTALMREFVMKGGTLLPLAHTNKHLKDGEAVPSGTSDIIDDLDCAYVLQTVLDDPITGRRTVEFKNRKRRGNVVETAAYSYSLQRDLSYAELLRSVEEVDGDSIAPIKRAADLEADLTTVKEIAACIGAGVNQRMAIKKAVSVRCRISHQTVLAVLDKYCGEDPTEHRWTYTVRERGAKVYHLLGQAEIAPG